MYDSNVTGKTQAELEKEGYYIGNFSNDVKGPNGGSTDHGINPNTGKAEPKPQGQG